MSNKISRDFPRRAHKSQPNTLVKMNDNQNNFVQDGRTTSRVLNPPGGKTSICLGSYVEPKKKENQVNAAEPKAPVQDQVQVVVKEQEKFAAPAPSATPALTVQPTASTQVCVSANAFASGANMNGANVLMGRPTSRVLAPPGGHTSIQLG